MRKGLRLVSVVLCLAGFPVFAASLLEIPVSSVGNVAYLSSIGDRPWWNASWKRRAPLLVSSTMECADAKATVDIVVDFGEPVNPDEIRIVTPWETVVPCVAESRGETKAAIWFQTPLRICENKPFLVYWGNPSATRMRPRTHLTLESDSDEFVMANGVIEVVFDRRGRTAGPLKGLRVLASQAPSQILQRASGYAWQGFELNAKREPSFGAGEVVLDNAYKKEIRFENDNVVLAFSLYPESPRLDWRYELKKGGEDARLEIAWLCGGDAGQDDIVYPGTRGKTLLLRAELDQGSDAMPHPRYSLGKFIGEGWLAIRDRRAGDVVGVLFDRSLLSSLDYRGHGQASGELTSFVFRHPRMATNKGHAGSLVAFRGEVKGMRDEYLRRKGAVLSVLGPAEAYKEHPLALPRLDHDFIADYNIGFGAGHGWRSAEPLDGSEWAENVMNRLRSYGANTARFGHYGDCTPFMKISEGHYNRLKTVAGKDGSSWKGRKWPDWTFERYDGRALEAYCAAAHTKGMRVSNWPQYLALGHGFRLDGKKADPEIAQLDREIQCVFAESGVDVVCCTQSGGESPDMPKAFVDKMGRQYWKWEDPSLYFENVVEPEKKRLRLCFAEARRRCPSAKFMVFTSENGEVPREKFMSESVGFFDSCYVEMLPEGKMPHCKYVAKRMRALFDNEAGRTVHHHFYFYNLTEQARVNEVEMPFICGVNGFSTENLTYEQWDREYSEIPADFYRFAEYTRLGAKASRMAPVRDVAVFRDGEAFRADIVAHRTIGSNPWDTYALGDRRVEAFAHVANLSWDIVINAHFTKESLRKYRVVYVPSDEVFSDALAKELLAYVNDGGGAIVEGATVNASSMLRDLGLRDREVRAIGKGRILYRKDILSETLVRGGETAAKDLCAALASVGSVQSYAVTNRKLDSVLQASDNGLLLGVYNLDPQKTQTATFTLRDPKVLPVEMKSSFVLDVMNGVRRPFAGSFEIIAGPSQCAYYLIGGEEFTKLPAVRKCQGSGADWGVEEAWQVECASGGFSPAVAIEFVNADKNGEPIVIRRSKEASIERVAFVESEEDRFFVALKKAKYVHFQSAAEKWDGLFASHRAEWRDFFTRGGGLFFDKVMPGKNAERFLTEVGVVNPGRSLAADSGGGTGVWNESLSTNSFLFAQLRPSLSRRLNYTRSFGSWDAKNQYAAYCPKHAPERAIVLAQEDVLGAGRVLFSSAYFVFTDRYDNLAFGDAVLSWLIGMSVKEHARNVEILNGGPGALL